jgi:hypothetical protein
VGAFAIGQNTATFAATTKQIKRRFIMTKTIKLSFLTAACFALSATTGFAQSTGRVQVKVPFEFSAGNATLPAGEYNFQEETTGVVFISSLDARKSVMVLTNPGATNNAATAPIVKFDKVNGVYNLTEVGMIGEPSRTIVRLENGVDRSASLAAHTSVGNSTSKSLKK